ncbi:MAG: hypothetical protein ACQEXV_22580 [Bacillota bacterium]
MSVLDLCLKLLDVLLKLVGITTGLNTLLNAWKQAQDKKNHRD